MTRAKISYYPIVLFLISLVIAMLTSCGSSKQEIIQVNPEFRQYVSGYTSGMISREDAIQIELAKEIANLEDVSEEELQELVKIEPYVDGKVVVVNDRLVEFVPKKPLSSNQFYTVSMELDKFVKVKDGFELFQFQFATHSQKVEVELHGLRNYSYSEHRFQRLLGTISTTDWEDSLAIRKTLSVYIDGNEVPYNLEAREDNEWEFSVDSIRRKETVRKIVAKWDGTPINSFSKGREEVRMPAFGDFKVSNMSVTENEDQYITLNFSEPLEEYQNLKGIVSIPGIEDLTYKINYNSVNVYIPKRHEGKYELKISQGVMGQSGYKMNTSFSRSFRLHKAKPMVRLIGSGSILPNSQGLIFPFEAIALKAVDVRVIRIHEKNVHHFLQVNNLSGNRELTRFGTVIAEKKISLTSGKKKDLMKWNTHVINLEKLIKPKPGAIYEIAIKFNKSYTYCDCNSEAADKPLTALNGGWNERDWHKYGYDGYSAWGYNDDDESPCDSDYYYGRAVKRNILASNIGMIFKLDDDKTSHAILSDMVSTAPMSNAKVSYYDYTNQLIASGTTNSEGMVKIKLKKKPFLMIARKGNQRGYLKLTDGHTNSLSKFDVYGERVQDGVKGFVYAERGVWRPGDSIFVNFILEDSHNTIPSNHPVNFELSDPNGNTVYEVSKTRHVNGVYDFRTATSSEAPTGHYTAYVQVGDLNFSKTIKVETIKPNRLKIYLDADNASLKDSCELTAKWLHGASGKGLKANVQVRLTAARTKFKGYKGYIFESPIRNGESYNSTVFDGKLDKNGKAKFAYKYSDVNGSSGKLNAHYTTKVFEKGGDFSIDRITKQFSPYKTYVGIDVPSQNAYDATLETGKTHRFNLVTLSSNGKLKTNKKLHVKIYKVSWNWWYDGHEDLASFTSRKSTILVKDKVLSNTSGKSYFDFKVKNDDYGKYLITVTDEKGGHQTGKLVHFDWPYWSRANRSNSEHATMLTFATDKKKYTKGENVRISFPSPSAGRALVSVESGEKVVKKFWVKTKKGETTCEFETTAAMAPNVFLHVTMIQPHNATKNDLPIRMYGVMPIEVDDPFTHLNPVITMKDKIRPESKASIKITEQDGRKMTYTLAVVDEGLLDLTHFATPQPWNTFYSKESIGVQTWDMYDDVIGAFSGRLDHLLSIGGGGSDAISNGPKANRFEPMVRYLGPFVLPAGGSKNHTVDIPNYVGSVRVMVVARDNESYGNAQKAVNVSKPLMVLATMPRVLGPGEEFNLPVNVFAMEKHIKNVSVKVEANDIFEISEPTSKNIQFTRVGDEIVNFKLKTKQRMGVGKVKVIARCGKEVSVQEIEIDIRPSNPYVFETEEMQLSAGASGSATVTFDGITGSQSASIEVSTLPAMNLDKRVGYLIHYPHGCVEQTTSAVFPQLYLSTLMDLKQSEKNEVERNVKAGIQRLQLFQTSEGGFSYWPGESYESEWGTNYAGNFILEAELMGYKLPSGMKSKWIAYQKDKAVNWTLDNSLKSRKVASNQLIQAYRLYLLAFCDKAEIGAMNRLREEKGLTDVAKWRLATAYATIGQKEAANKIIKDASTSVARYRELSFGYGSGLRDQAIILEAQSALSKKNAYENVKSIAQQLGSNRWMNTQETAYCLMSIAKYSRANGSGTSGTMSYSLDGGSTKTVKANRTVQRIQIATKGKSSRSISIKNTGKAMLFVTITTKKIPKVGKEKSKSSKMTMAIVYKDMEGNEVSVDKLKQGTEFLAEITVSNTAKYQRYEEMAINQIFPSGWEIHNSRLFGSKGYSSDVRYQDYRDDRVLSYYSLNAGESKTITVLLNATYKGRFYLPAVRTEAMYDHNIHAQIAGKWIVVE